ncbi:MAG TPA: chromate resistance protein ChrB domain-containing protein [Vicinamibacterales bacterium]|nr:chromate resistance protein ChrB domain-containing protein [Vicinamibacterales bacterium]
MRWLLLVHQVPPNARVKIWRRLQDVGAVQARNAVYVLPNTDACREDFEWIRSEIAAAGGSATIFAADTLDPTSEEEIVATFQRSRTDDYRLLAEEASASVPAARRDGRAIARLRQRFEDIDRHDFFRAAARQTAAEAISALESKIAPRIAAKPSGPALPIRDFKNRRWVTRRRPGVDRMASAWLIRRYIDPGATFAFADAPIPNAIPFDMYAGEFSHQGTLCTFEVLAARFRLSNPVITHIAHIVHDLDMKETRYAPPEAPAVARLIDGLRALHRDDHDLLEQGRQMFEALAKSFESMLTSDAARPARRRRRLARHR